MMNIRFLPARIGYCIATAVNGFAVAPISGESMLPTFKNGEYAVIRRKRRKEKLKENEIVIAFPTTDKYSSEYKLCRPLIKRIAAINNGSVFIKGDNLKHSKDSRSFGWISEKDIKYIVYGMPVKGDKYYFFKTAVNDSLAGKW